MLYRVDGKCGVLLRDGALQRHGHHATAASALATHLFGSRESRLRAQPSVECERRRDALNLHWGAVKRKGDRRLWIYCHVAFSLCVTHDSCVRVHTHPGAHAHSHRMSHSPKISSCMTACKFHMSCRTVSATEVEYQGLKVCL